VRQWTMSLSSLLFVGNVKPEEKQTRAHRFPGLRDPLRLLYANVETGRRWCLGAIDRSGKRYGEARNRFRRSFLRLGFGGFRTTFSISRGTRTGQRSRVVFLFTRHSYGAEKQKKNVWRNDASRVTRLRSRSAVRKKKQ